MPTHELIGSTTVDLEDRWFHKKWQGIKTQKNSDGILMLEPLEMRNLYSPDSAVAQGQLEMWVEILPTNQAGNKPKSELFGPPEKKFELRIIVWKSKDVPKHRGINLFNKVELQGFKAKQTDTHWKCKGGAGSWNWRMKFPVTFPVKSPLYGRLNVQMWNRDIISSNDIISEYAIGTSGAPPPSPPFKFVPTRSHLAHCPACASLTTPLNPRRPLPVVPAGVS